MFTVTLYGLVSSEYIVLYIYIYVGAVPFCEDVSSFDFECVFILPFGSQVGGHIKY